MSGSSLIPRLSPAPWWSTGSHTLFMWRVWLARLGMRLVSPFSQTSKVLCTIIWPSYHTSPPITCSHTHTCTVTIGQNQPLLREPVVWTSEVPLTEGQLEGKRDTFWETEPTYEGRKEIWDALRAAVEAAEQEDYDLAQAILSGANISLPTGQQGYIDSWVGGASLIPGRLGRDLPFWCLLHSLGRRKLLQISRHIDNSRAKETHLQCIAEDPGEGTML